MLPSILPTPKRHDTPVTLTQVPHNPGNRWHAGVLQQVQSTPTQRRMDPVRQPLDSSSHPLLINPTLHTSLKHTWPTYHCPLVLLHCCACWNANATTVSTGPRTCFCEGLGELGLAGHTLDVDLEVGQCQALEVHHAPGLCGGVHQGLHSNINNKHARTSAQTLASCMCVFSMCERFCSGHRARHHERAISTLLG